MALKKDHKTATGIIVKGAFFRIESVKVNKTSMQLSVNVSAKSDTPVIDNFGYAANYDLTGGNPLEQAYCYVKGLPEFDGATDV